MTAIMGMKNYGMMIPIRRILLSVTFLVSISLNVSAQALHFFPIQKDSLVFSDSTGLVYEVLRDSVSVYGNATIEYLHPEIELFANQMSFCVGRPYGNSMLGSKIVSFANRSYLIFDEDSIAIPHILNLPLLSVFRGDSIIIELVSVALDTTNQLPDTIFNYAIIPSGNNSFSRCLNSSELLISKSRGLLAFPGCFKTYLQSNHGYPGPLVASSIQQFSYQDFGPYPLGTIVHFEYYERWSSSSFMQGFDNDEIVSTQPIQIRRIRYRRTQIGPNISFLRDTIITNSFFNQGWLPLINWVPTNQIIDSSISYISYVNRIDALANQGLPRIRVIVSTPGLDTCLLASFGDSYLQESDYSPILGQVGAYQWQSTQGNTYGNSRWMVYFNNGTTTWGTPHSISISEFEQEREVKIFPVPASNHISIVGLPSSEHSFSWKIYDLKARTLKTGDALISDSFIDISDLSSGLYILEINGNMIFKIVKN